MARLRTLQSKGGINIKPSHRGLLHEDLGIPQDEPISATKMASAAHSKDPAVRKRATFAKNMNPEKY